MSIPVLLLYLCFLQITTVQSTSVASGDLHVLLDLRSSLSITPSAPGFESWTASTHPCNFSFVTCDPEFRIVSINLTLTAVTGTLPFRSLCLLPRLSTFSAASNHLRGPLDPSLRNCTSLTLLDLSHNALVGPIPDLSPLSSLRVLNLSSNNFNGSLPDLGNLTGLTALSLGDIPFDPTPFPAWVIRLRKITNLYLSNCSITGRIPPGIGNLTALGDLELSYNSLTGGIPAEIGKLPGLWQLELYRNSLTGNLPVGFGNLTSLRYLDASSNLLQGNLSEIRTLRNLLLLHLYYNNFSGGVPPELGEFADLVDLSLYNNRLSGELPRGLGSLADFQLIDVSTNELTGVIPPDMCRRGMLQKLLMLENRFTGAIPASYGNCVTLVRFRVSDNELSGEVPQGIWSLPKVNIIDLARNRFAGGISAGIGRAKALNELLISNNELSGGLPEVIGGAIELVAIDASSNRLSGTLPATIGDLRRLNRLILRNNKLSGDMPSSLASCKSLNVLDLSGNEFTGGIPATIGELAVLNTLNLSGNSLSGVIPSSLSALKLTSLDLSRNRLQGPVPSALAIAAFHGSFRGNPGLCGGEVVLLPPCPTTRLRSADSLRVILATLIAIAAILLASLGCFLFRHRRRHVTGTPAWNVKSYRVLSFDEKEIVSGVLPENLIGSGGSGSVYGVRLRDGSTVAVKQIKNMVEGSGSSRFEAEVETLSSLRHVGVVNLYCSITREGGERLLVYEYLCNGSLWDRLHVDGEAGRGRLGWTQRYEVALGAARGLEYLHHGCERPILHRDVKSSNILLDEDLRPRIADFGLAKTLLPAREDESSGIVAGTHGYMAPEYAYTRRVSEKSDVYSFGVVLMELVTGKRPIEPCFGDNRSIVNWIYTRMACGEEVVSLLDSVIPKEYEGEAIKVFKVGVLCTVRSPSLRPPMRVVVQMLEDAARWRKVSDDKDRN